VSAHYRPGSGDVRDWLARLGLDKYAPAFEENALEIDDLGSLTDDELKQIGVAALGHRKRLLAAIAELGETRAGLPAEGRSPAVSPRPRRAERRQLTIMFVDLVGSTALSGRLDPEELSQLLRDYQKCVAVEIERFEGYVATYVGDGVVAYFGWPRAHEDQAERAVRAGLALASAVERMTMPTDEPLRVRVGIASGLVVVGDLLDGLATKEDSVIGQTPNIAARLQTVAEPGQVLIDEETRKLIGKGFDLSDLGLHHLKGVSDPVSVFAVKRPKPGLSRFEAKVADQLAPLRGREYETALICSVFDRVRTGRGQVLLVGGEAGIGKSRLLQALMDHVCRLGGEIRCLQCSSFHTNSPLHPVIEHLRSAAALIELKEPDDQLDRIEALLRASGSNPDDAAPVLAKLLSIPADHRYKVSEVDPQMQKEQTLEAICRLVLHVAEGSALLLVVEDAHWLDPTTREIVDQLVARSRKVPVLIAVTHRKGFDCEWVRVAEVTRLQLSPLNPAAVDAIVLDVARGRRLPAPIMEAIRSTTDGVPLFVEELTRTILESGALLADHEGYRLQVLVGEVTIPPTVRDSLAERLDRLSTGAEVAQFAATIGREFSAQMLTRIVDMPEAALDEQLEHLCEAGILYRPQGPASDLYSFRHALMQEVAYQSQLKTKRREIHRRLAEVLESDFPQMAVTSPETIAHHFAEAGNAEKASDYLLAAGRAALRLSATSEALVHLGRALELAQTLPPSTARARRELRLHASLGTAHMLARGWAAPEVETAYLRAHELIDAAENTAEAVWILWGVWVARLVRGEINRIGPIGEQVMAMADADDDPATTLIAHMMLMQATFYGGRFHDALRHAEAVERLYSAEDHRRLSGLYTIDIDLVAKVHGSLARWILGQTDQAIRTCAAGEILAKRLDHAYSTAWVLTWGSTPLLLDGAFDQLIRRVDEGVALAEERGFAYVAAIGTMVWGYGLAARGDPAAGLGRLRAGLRAFRATGARIVLPFFLTLEADLLRRLGRPEDALLSLSAAEAQIDQWGERWQESEVARIRGDVLAGTDRIAAEACYRRAIDLARRTGAEGWLRRACFGLARLLVADGRRNEALELARPFGVSLQQICELNHVDRAPLRVEGDP
jgi:class 3 adenylate cyclase/tetratricopeptide (TPR) repeat protein